jgi:hypothetical protein
LEFQDMKIKNLVVISDTHFGSSVALSQIHQLDDGGYYHPSPVQAKLYKLWVAFWEWAYQHIGREPFAIVHVGDVTDGVHHRTTQLSSGNLSTQASLAVDMLQPHVSRAKAYFQIRGTEAHVGASAQEEEQIAKALGAVQDKETGNYSRWELWLKFGENKQHLIHFAHHLGHTSSSSYESSALMREVVAAFGESGQWGFRAPGLVIRGHTHRYLKIEGPGGWVGIKMPSWQAKTAFTYKIDRLRGPMFGGLLVRDTNEGMETKAWIKTVKQTTAVEL